MSSIIFIAPRYAISGKMKGKLRGVGNTTISLAESLAARGHYVECFSPVENKEEYNGVIWDNKINKTNYDLAIANLYPKGLGLVTAKQSALWIHNPMNKWSRFKKCVWGIFRHNPSAVFLSKYNYETTPGIIPYKSRHIIEHGIDEFFINSKVKRSVPEKPIAIFSSAAHRNLDIVIESWKEQINPIIPEAELHLFTDIERVKISPEEAAKYQIKLIGRVPHEQLAQAYSQARLLIYPGHLEETFCNAAHEATACGLPIVTLGIGVLSERVDHEKNGIIAKDKNAMGQAIIEILRDDDAWLKLHHGAVNTQTFYTWDNRAEVWEKIFL